MRYLRRRKAIGVNNLLHTTLGELLSEQAKQFPTTDAVVYPELGLRWSYEQFNEKCNLLAKGLMKLGIEKGEHISIWASNKPEWLLTQFATGKMGAVLVTVNTNYQAQELEYLLRSSDSSTIILMEGYRDTSYIDILYRLCPELHTSEPGELTSERFPKLKNVIIIGEHHYPGTYHWTEVVQLGNEITDEQLTKRVNSLLPDDAINMQYTSGTTGFPKGVMLTHHNIINNGYQIAQSMRLTEEDRLCIPVPFFHCFGCVLGTIASITVGATMVPTVEFSAKRVLEAIESERCTAVHGVPTMFIAELNDPDFASYDLSSLRTGIMAGSNCPIEIMKDVIEKMGVNEITIAYGQTETSPVITQTRIEDPIEVRVETVGRALPNVEIKIVDPETKEDLPVGEVGELCTRGYHVMKGYYNNEAATKEVIDENGWLHTGDLGLIDENGYVKITGRLKDMIIRGGENIYPREIEEFLYTHPKVLDIQVVGVPDPLYGEEVMAWIIPKKGEAITSSEIIDYCKGKIARHKIPRYVEFTDSFPMTASGKIQKYKLKELASVTTF